MSIVRGQSGAFPSEILTPGTRPRRYSDLLSPGTGARWAARQRREYMSQAASFVPIDELIGRYVHAQLVYVAAKLGRADLLGDGPRTVAEIAAARGAYDFSAYQRVVDIGGGNGIFLSLLLQQYPQMEGILFDLPVARVQSAECLEQTGVAQRCAIISGDFFVDALPESGDLYLLSLIIHDWNDEQALRILRNCRRAMSMGSKLVLIEFLLSAPDESARVANEDLFMLVVTGGRERTFEQFRTLLARADLQLLRAIPTQGRRSVLEAIPC